MAAQKNLFFPVISIGVFPGRDVCRGQFSVFAPPTIGLRPDHTAIQYRRATTRTGELDGAKDVNGG